MDSNADDCFVECYTAGLNHNVARLNEDTGF